MINIRIYCKRNHKDYDKVYNVISEVLLSNNLDFKIERISEAKVMAMHRIIYEPHIVINNQIVYARSCPTKDEVTTILQRLRIIK